MNFEIYTVGTGYFLEKTFHAIRLVMGGGGFTWLLKLSIIVSLVVLICKSVFDFNPKSIIHYFIKVTIITSVFIAPIAQVHIKDTLPDQYGIKKGPRMVDKVPVGLAAMVSLSSTVGNWLGDKFESSFSAVMPNESFDSPLALFIKDILSRTTNKGTRVL